MKPCGHKQPHVAHTYQQLSGCIALGWADCPGVSQPTVQPGYYVATGKPVPPPPLAVVPKFATVEECERWMEEQAEALAKVAVTGIERVEMRGEDNGQHVGTVTRDACGACGEVHEVCDDGFLACGRDFMAGTICSLAAGHLGGDGCTCHVCGGDWYEGTCECPKICATCGENEITDGSDECIACEELNT